MKKLPKVNTSEAAKSGFAVYPGRPDGYQAGAGVPHGIRRRCAG